MTYVGYKWQRFQLILPVLTQHDGIIFEVDGICSVSLVQCILDQFFHHIFIKRVGHVEHVFPVALPALGILGWEILGHVIQHQELIYI